MMKLQSLYSPGQEMLFTQQWVQQSLCEGRRGISWLGWENIYSLPAHVAFTDPGGSQLGQSSSPDPFLRLQSVLHFPPVIIHPGLNLVTITVEI